MSTAVYDNPSTQCREVWVDGRVVELAPAVLVVAHPEWLFRSAYFPGRAWEPLVYDGDLAAFES